MDISLESYRIFREVARTGGVSKAAGALFVSQSAVSQAIKQLENRLGTKLFDRAARGVRLTTEGEVLFSYVNGAVTLIENAREKLSRMRELRAGEIKIGASDTICGLFLLPLLKKFNAEYPDIRISVTNRTTRESVALLKDGAVDLAFINLPADEDAALEITPVMPIHDCFAAGEKYAFLAGSVMRLRDLRNYPVLMLEKASNTRRRMDMFLSGHDAELRPAIELGALSLLAEFAQIGLGIAATIREDIREKLEKNELFELRFAEALPTRHIGLARTKDVTMSFAAKAFAGMVLTI
ncbi:MAG: LysR family transcriptional regulator [Firmicutes bacterium]|nr:LysR family transcriptional regulator [Bacillota bacterium]